MGELATWKERVLSDPRRLLPYVIGSGRADQVMEVLRENPQLLNTRLSRNATPLLTAAYEGQLGIAESLLAMGARMDFITAIALNRITTVRTLIDGQPLLIRTQSPDQTGCMQIAARYANKQMLELLISAGGDVNDCTNPKRLTPLFYAWKEPYDRAELLLARGANVNARSKSGFTVLHFAAKAGRLRLVELLLAHGAWANAQTRGRQTPWALAVGGGHREVSTLLMSAQGTNQVS